MKSNHRLHRLTQIGLMALIIILGMGYGVRDAGYEIPDEIIIVKAPEKNRNPYQEEYERMLYPTVRITAGFSTGSGVVISNTNHTNKDEWTRIDILTAAHVVEDQSTVDIELYDSSIITGTVVITDTVKDLALIRIINPPDPLPTCLPAYRTGRPDRQAGRQAFDKGGSKGGFYSATLAPRDYTPYLFTPVWAVGCSLGLNPRPSFGHITSCPLVSIRGFEISAPILPGNSGGPVYDARTYEVIGIAVWVKVYRAYLPTGQAGRQAGDGQLITTMVGVVSIGEIYNFLNQVDK